MTDNFVKRAVQAQFCARPTLRSVVAQMLDDNLKEKYPPLTMPVAALRLALPRDGGGRDLRPLLSVALDYIATQQFPDWTTQGGLDAYLSDATGTRLTFQADEPRDYDLAVIEAVIRELPSILPIFFQDALAAFWDAPSDAGGSRWRWLAGMLQGQFRDAAIRQLGHDATALQLLARLADCPARQTGSQQPSLHAYSVETRLAHGATRMTVQSSDILVVANQHVLLCRLSGQIDAYASLNAFGEAWGQRMAERFVCDSLTWHLYEPDGNIFEVQAALLLNGQLDNLAAVDLRTITPLTELETLFDAITDPAAPLSTAPLPSPQPLAAIEASLPDWLQRATPDLRFAYRRCLLEQASTRRLEAGKTWLDELDDLRTYARRHLDNQLCLARNAALTGKRTCDSDSPKYQADKLELTVNVAAGTLAGGYVEPVRMSLVDLALNNLSGKPKGRMTLRDTDEQDIEPWLTPEFIEQLVQRVDVGLNYPNYIRRELLGDTDVALQRKRLFTIQRPLELKSQALELAIRHEAGFSAKGAEYVTAVVAASRAERYVDDKEIVMRPLAFQRKPGAKADVVQHMFIIEPRNNQNGPCVLYRPAYHQALLEFSSREQLLVAIVKAGEVQDSVLAWLSDSARVIYSNGGFIQPHYVRIAGIGSAFDPLPPVPKPATLVGADDESNDEILQSLVNGLLMEYLYTSEARQLLEQADRQTTSNTESRWALILEGAQLGFNTLLMLVRGPLAAVGWLVQLAQSLAQDIPALASTDPVARELAWVDLLLNTAMVMIHHATSPPSPRPDDQRALTRLPLRRTAGQAVVPPSIKRGAFGLPAEPPGGGRTLLDFDRSLASDSASARLLEKLLGSKVPWPDPLPKPAEIGRPHGLYNVDGVWHAAVGGLFFRVTIVPGFDEVFIVHPDKPGHPGIKLKTDGKGHWTLDRGLKLAGGGPKNRLKTMREAKQRRLEELQSLSNALALELTEPMNALQASLTRLSEALISLRRQAKTLQVVWTLKRDAGPSHELAFNTRYQREKNNYLSLKTQYQILLDTLQERFDQVLPDRLKIVDILKEAQELKDANEANQLSVTMLKDIASQHLDIITYIKNWMGTLKFAESDEPKPSLRLLLEADKWMSGTDVYNESRAEAVELADSLQRMIVVAQSMETIFERLEQTSPTGGAIRSSLLASVEKPEFYASASLQLEALFPLSRLAVKPPRPGHVQSPQEVFYATQLDPQDLLQAVLSHMEVRSTADYSLVEQRQVYDTVLEVYRRYDHASNALKTINPERLLPTTERFLNGLREARLLAENELESVASRQETVETRHPKPRDQRAKAATKRVFKTRKQRYFIGDFKPGVTATDREQITINSGLTESAVATYEQQTDGWAIVQKDAASSPEPLPTARPLATLKALGQEMVRQRQGIERLVSTQQQKLQSPLTRQEVDPADWDELLTGQASSLKQLADEIAREHRDAPTAQDLIDDFRANARDMERMAQRVVSAAYKQQWPTLKAIQYLWDHGEIDINLTSPADPQRPTLRGDFFTEYAVYDKAQKPPVVLWYAHFHYANATAPANAYTVAHLKLAEQRKYTQKDLLKQHVQAHLQSQQAPGVEPLGKILYVPIVPPQDALFLAIAPT